MKPVYLLLTISAAVLSCGTSHKELAEQRLNQESVDFIEKSTRLNTLSIQADAKLNGVWNEQQSIVSFISGPLELSSHGGIPDGLIEENTLKFVNMNRTLFGIKEATEELSFKGIVEEKDGMKHLFYQQVFKGVAVYGGVINVHLKAENRVVALNSSFIPMIKVENTTPSITGKQAVKTLFEIYKFDTTSMSEPRICIRNRRTRGIETSSALCWQVNLPVRGRLYFVDASSGELFDSLKSVFDVKSRATFNAKFSSNVPTKATRIEGDGPCGDAEVDRAHDLIGNIYDFFFQRYSRDSYDAKGGQIKTIVNYRTGSEPWQNAYWRSDENRMYFGEKFMVGDIAAHEFTHGITGYSITDGLEYYYESGALNESFSDILAVAFDDDDWEIGDELEQPLRSFENPSKYGDPAHTKDWVTDCEDEGGVHTNSNIFNRAFFNIAQSSIGREKAAAIFFRTLSAGYLTHTSTFNDARLAVIRATKDIDGEETDMVYEVIKGFDDAGIDGKWAAPKLICPPDPS